MEYTGINNSDLLYSDVVPVIARGVMELRDKHGIDASTERQIHYFLDRFYMSKISIRMLQHQHSTLAIKFQGFSCSQFIFSSALFTETFQC